LETVVYVFKLFYSLFKTIVLLKCPSCFHTSIPDKNNAATPHTIEAELRWIRSFESFFLFFGVRR
jgi:hypothetical protein